MEKIINLSLHKLIEDLQILSIVGVTDLPSLSFPSVFFFFFALLEKKKEEKIKHRKGVGFGSLKHFQISAAALSTALAGAVPSK